MNNRNFLARLNLRTIFSLILVCSQFLGILGLPWSPQPVAAADRRFTPQLFLPHAGQVVTALSDHQRLGAPAAGGPAAESLVVEGTPIASAPQVDSSLKSEGPSAPKGLDVTVFLTASTVITGKVYNGETITYSAVILNRSNLPVSDIFLTGKLPHDSSSPSKYVLAGPDCLTCTWEYLQTSFVDPSGGAISLTTKIGIKWDLTTPLEPGMSATLVYSGRVLGVTEGDLVEAGMTLNYHYSPSGTEYLTGTYDPKPVTLTGYLNMPVAGSGGVVTTPSWISADMGGTIHQDWGDFNRDGYLDLALASSRGLVVYRNEAVPLNGGNDPTAINFRNRRLVAYWTAPKDSDRTRMAFGVRWADLNNDGWLDLIAVGDSVDGSPMSAGINYIYQFNRSSNNPPLDVRFTLMDKFYSDLQLVRIAAGDFDNDKDIDLVASTNLINARRPLIYYPNNGTGVFTGTTPVPIGEQATAALGPADYDGDGDLDLAVGVFPNMVRVWINECAGYAQCNLAMSSPFSATDIQTVETGLEYVPYDLVWADYDLDGMKDLAAAFPLQREARIYRNLGGGAFQRFNQTIYTSLFMTPLALDWGDFNGDGRPDLAVADSPIKVYSYDDGHGSQVERFYAIKEMEAPPGNGQMWSLRGIDSTGRGSLDLVGTSRDGPSQLFTAMTPKLNPILNPIPSNNVAYYPAASLAWGDIDQDGDLDLMAGDHLASTTSFARAFFNDESGGFYSNNTQFDPVSGSSPTRVALGDINNDGKLDLVMASRSGVYIFRNSEPGSKALIMSNMDPVKSLALADFDDDSYLDLMIGQSIQTQPGIVTGRVTLYKLVPGANRTYVATEVFSTTLPGSAESIAWVDFDRDNFLDFAVGVYGGYTTIYRYVSRNSFLPLYTSAFTAATRSISWADYDRDGDMDMALGSENAPVQIWENRWAQRDTSPFIVSYTVGSTVSVASLAWGDWDNDSYADLAIGQVMSTVLVYGNLASTPGSAPRLAQLWSSKEILPVNMIAWGDRDNDGDLDLGVALDSSLVTNTKSLGFYENTMYGAGHLTNADPAARALLNMSAYAYVARPAYTLTGGTPDAYFYSAGGILGQPSNPTAYIKYKAYDMERDIISTTLFEYSVDGGATWATAGAATGSPLPVTSTAVTGAVGTYYWNPVKNYVIGDDARFRVRLIMRNKTGPVNRAMGIAVSPPFRVRGITCTWPTGLAISTNPARPTPGEVVTVTATTAPGPTALNIRLDLGDGTITDKFIVTHTYKNRGYYSITLVVQGDACPVSRTARARIILNVGMQNNVFLPIVMRSVTRTAPLIAVKALERIDKEPATPSAFLANQPDPSAVHFFAGAADSVVSESENSVKEGDVPSTTVERSDWAENVRRISDITFQLTRYSYWVNSQPAVNADGNRIAFWSTGSFGTENTNEDGNIEIFLARLDPLEKVVTFTQVTSSTGSILAGFNLNPSINDKGDRVVFFSDRDLVPGSNSDHNFEIFMAVVEDNQPIRLIQLTKTSRGLNVMPSISRNGEYVVYASDMDSVTGIDDGQTDIYLLPITDVTGIPEPVLPAIQVTSKVLLDPVSEPLLDDQPVVSNNGTKVAFVSNRNYRGNNPDHNREIYLADFYVGLGATTTITYVQVTSSTNALNDSPSLDSEGALVAYVSNYDYSINQALTYRKVFVSRYYPLTYTSVLTKDFLTMPGDMEQPTISGDGGRVGFVALDGGGQYLNLYDLRDGTYLIEPHTLEGIYPSLSSNGASLVYIKDWNLMLTKYPYADLSLGKSVTPTGILKEHVPVTYTLVITNNGPSPMTSALITDSLPGEMSPLNDWEDHANSTKVFTNATISPVGTNLKQMTGTGLIINGWTNPMMLPSSITTTNWVDMRDNLFSLNYVSFGTGVVTDANGIVFSANSGGGSGLGVTGNGWNFGNTYNSSINLNNSRFDLQMPFAFISWVRPGQLLGAEQIFINHGGDYRIYRSTTGTLVLRFNTTVLNPAIVNSDYFLPLNTWSHVGVVIDAYPLGNRTTVEFYVNGSMVSRQTIPGVPVPGSTSGALLSIGYQFIGNMDETAVFSRALSSKEIETIYTLQSARSAGFMDSGVITDPLRLGWRSLAWWTNRPVGKDLLDYMMTDTIGTSDYLSGNISVSATQVLLHFNEPEKSQIYVDASGNGRNGICSTLSNCPRTGVLGRVNGSADFDGIDDWVQLDNFRLGGSFTLGMWYMPDNGTSYPLLSKIITTTSLFTLSLAANTTGYLGNRVYSLVLPKSPALFFTRTVPYPGEDRAIWRHLALVVQPTESSVAYTVTLYENAFPVGTSVLTPTGGIVPWDSINSSELWALGRDASANRYYQGKMDDVILLSQPLTAREIEEIYLRGVSRIFFQIQRCELGAVCNAPFVGPDGTSGSYYSELDNELPEHPQLALPSLNNNPTIRYRVYQASDLIDSFESRGPSVRRLELDPLVKCSVYATSTIRCAVASSVAPLVPHSSLSVVLPLTTGANLFLYAAGDANAAYVTNYATVTTNLRERDYITVNNTSFVTSLLSDLPVTGIRLSGNQYFPYVPLNALTVVTAVAERVGIARHPITYIWKFGSSAPLLPYQEEVWESPKTYTWYALGSHSVVLTAWNGLSTPVSSINNVIVEEKVGGYTLTTSSPTRLHRPTLLTVSVPAGTFFTYTLNFDGVNVYTRSAGATGGLVASHLYTYPAAEIYTPLLTIYSHLGVFTATARVSITQLCKTRLELSNGEFYTYTTIQDAVNASKYPGDLVKVSGYCYGESNHLGHNDIVTVSDRVLTIRGGYDFDFNEPPNSTLHPTVVDGEGLARIFHLSGGSQITIENLIMQNGYLASGYGGAVYVEGTMGARKSQLVLLNSEIMSSTAYDGGGAIYFESGTGNHVIQDVKIHHNRVVNSNGEGGGVGFGEANVLITHTAIYSNAASYGAGLSIGSGGVGTVYSSTIYQNAYTQDCGGINNNNHGTLHLNYTLVATNTGGAKGGGVCSNGIAEFFSTTIRNNQAIGVGGGIYVSDAGNGLSILNSVVVSNTAQDGGGIYVENGLNNSIVDSVISGNLASGRGGGIYNNAPNLNLYSTKVESNTSSQTSGGGGGGIYLFNTVNITGGSVSYNRTSSSNGGGIYMEVGTVLLDHVNLISNTSGQHGGAYYISSGTLNVISSTFSRNKAMVDGGAIGVGTGKVTIVSSTFQTNTAGAQGGALMQYNMGASGNGVFVDQSNFLDNRAATNGGALAIASAGYISVSNSVISHNVATQEGGGVYAMQPYLALLGNQIISNTGRRGGGLYVETVDPGSFIRDNRFERNATAQYGSVTPDGGAMYMVSITYALPVVHNDFINNRAVRNGGGVYIWHSPAATFDRAIFRNNSAGDSGGGIEIVNSTGIRLINQVLIGNWLRDDYSGSNNRGGGLHVYNSIAHVLYATFNANMGGTETHEDAVFVNDNGLGTTLYMTNVILANQRDGSNGYPIYVRDSSTVRIFNVLWYSNTNNLNPCFEASGSANCYTNTQVLGNPNPLFEADGYHIPWVSPAREAGIVPVGTSVTYDIDGDPRPVGVPDLGADEMAYGVTITKTKDYTEVLAGQTVAYTIVVQNIGLIAITPTVQELVPPMLTPISPTNLVFSPGELISNEVWTMPMLLQVSSTYTGPATTTASVWVTGTSITQSAALPMVITETPVSGISLNHSPARHNQSTYFTATLVTGTNVLYTWNFGDGSAEVLTPSNTITHAYQTTETYQVYVTATNSRPSMVVTSTPVIVMFGEDIPVEGLDFAHTLATEVSDRIYFTASTTSGSNIHYSWDMGNGTSFFFYNLKFLSYTYNLPGNYTVTLVASNTKGAMTVTRLLHVLDKPVEGFVFTPTLPAETGLPVAFSSYISNGTNVVYSWNYGDGSSVLTGTSPNNSHAYAAPNTYTIIVTAANSRNLMVDTHTITVDTRINTLGITHSLPNWSEKPIYFTATLVTGTNVIYQWTFDTLTPTYSSKYVTLTFVPTQSYRVYLTATNSLSSYYATKLFTVTDQPIEGLTFTHSSLLWIARTITFTPFLTQGTGYTYSWNFGDGSPVQPGTIVTHVFATPSWYTVSVTATNSMGSRTFSRYLQLWDQEVAGLGITHTLPTSTALPIMFTAVTTQGTNLLYLWDFGDGTVTATSNPVTHTYAVQGSYWVSVTVSNGSNSLHVSNTCTVRDQPIYGLTFAHSMPDEINVPVAFTASITQGTGVNYTWNFGDGTGEAAPITAINTTYIYTVPGVYTARLTATNTSGVPAYYQQVITVDRAISNVGYLNSSPLWVDVPITLTGIISSGSMPIYTWRFTDSTTWTGPWVTRVYTLPGTYDVYITASNTLTPVFRVIPLVVHDQPINGLVLNAMAPITVNEMTTFSATITQGTHVNYTFTFTDGQRLVNPATYTFTDDGPHTVTVTASNEISTVTATRVVTVYKPILGVDFTNSVPAVGTLTTFTASVTQGSYVAYIFNILGVGVFPGNPISYTFSSTGTPTVIVTATNALGSLSMSHTITVAQPISNLNFTRGVLDVARPVVLTATKSTGWPVQYSWSLTTSVTQTGQVATFNFANPGDYSVTVTATNQLNTEVFSALIRVEKAITGLSVLSAPPFVTGTANTFTATYTDGWPVTAYNWSFSNGETFSGLTVTPNLTEAKVYTLWLTATNTLTPAYYTRQITVESPLTNVDFLWTTPTNVANDVRFTGTVGGGWPVLTYTFAFTAGAGLSGTLLTGYPVTQHFADHGVYSVVVTASNSLGSISSSRLITVERQLAGATFASTHPIEAGVPMVFTGSVTSGWPILTHTYSLTSGTIFFGSPTATYTFIQPGAYTVWYTAQNGLGSVYYTKVVTVESVLAPPSFLWSSPAEVTRPVIFTGTSGGGWPVLTYTFGFTDNTSISGPLTATRSFTAPGSYSVIVTAANSLSTISNVFPIIVREPVAGFTVTTGMNVFTESEVITFSASVTRGWPMGYSWSFYDGSHLFTGTGAEIAATISPAGLYSMVVTATSGLTPVTYTRWVTVESLLTGPYFTVTEPLMVSQPITFNGGVATGWPVLSYTFHITPGNSIISGTSWATKTFPTAGVYTVVVTATNHLTAVSATQTIFVRQPVAGLAFTATTSALQAGQTITFNATVTQGWPVTYFWSISAISETLTGSGSPIVTTVAGTGVYSMVVTATNGVTAITAGRWITIESSIPSVSFTSTTPADVASTIQFTASIPSGWPAVYTWTVTNGTVTNTLSGNPVTANSAIATPGYYTVVVTASNGLGPVSATNRVTVYQHLGTANIDHSWREVGKGVYFTPTVSAGWPLTYSWVFTHPSGTVTGPVLAVNPVVTFATQGVGTATLVVTNPFFNEVVTVTMLFTVDTAISGLNITPNDDVVGEYDPCMNADVTFVAHGTGTNIQYSWIMTDPGGTPHYATGPTAVFHMGDNVIHQFALIATNGSGIVSHTNPIKPRSSPCTFTGYSMLHRKFGWNSVFHTKQISLSSRKKSRAVGVVQEPLTAGWVRESLVLIDKDRLSYRRRDRF